MYRFSVLPLLLVFCTNCRCNGIGAFDDTVLFKLNWPGKLPNVDDNLAEAATTPPSQEVMRVTSVHNERYECYLPNLVAKEPTGVNHYNGPTALQLLNPLFSQKICSFRLESYWSYELCHGRYLRQYHEEREGKKVKTQEYFLGKWNKEKQIELEQAMAESEIRGDKMKYKKIDGLNLPYVEVEMEDGTLCDINGRPRVTKVQYVCYVHGKHEVYSFKETSTCEYEVLILSPFLCAHPKYRPQESGENIINCIGLDDAPKKPRSLLAMEAETLKLSRQMHSISNENEIGKDVVAVFKLEKVNEDGEARFKIELHPLNDYKAKASTPLSLDAKSESAAPPEISSEKSPKHLPIDDNSPVKDFLNGEDCLSGGSGWWKYEFCYGRWVQQYHVERGGQRTVVLLGSFTERDHLAWLQENPHKRPKPAGKQRTYISHFYSNGDVCDKTSLPRQTEVKLKCLENASSPNQVSLYLLEPRTCQYILGIESPLICDILDLADENGLIKTKISDALAQSEPRTNKESTVITKKFVIKGIDDENNLEDIEEKFLNL